MLGKGQAASGQDPAGQAIDPNNPAGGEGNQDPGQQQDGGEQIPENIKQYFKSGYGRLDNDVKGIKQTIEDFNNKFEDALSRLSTAQHGQFGPQGQQFKPGDPRQQVNEMLAESWYTGDIFGTLERFLQIKQGQMQNLSQQQQTRLKKALVGLKDREGYENLYPDIERYANEAMQKPGTSPESAADLAYFRALTESLQNKEQDNIGVAQPGMRRPRTPKKPELPPAHKDALARGKQEGLFKDEADYISALSPVVRRELGYE